MDEEKNNQVIQNRDSGLLQSADFWKTVILILLFSGSILLLIQVNNLNRQLNELTSNHQGLLQRVDSLRTIVSLPIDQDFKGLLTRYDFNFLRQKGLDNPVETLKTDLVSRTDLIPQKGILGGTMRFYEDQIYILSSRWVMAYYDDGHIVGQMLLRYTVSLPGRITWEMIDAYQG
mgnify:CR=1 FL=1